MSGGRFPRYQEKDQKLCSPREREKERQIDRPRETQGQRERKEDPPLNQSGVSNSTPGL